MRGKTEAEVVQISEQLAGLARQSLLNQPSYVQAPQAYAQQPQVAPQPLDPNDYITGAHLQALIPQFQAAIDQRAQQVAEPAIQAAARSTYQMVKEKHADLFARYGHEIDGHLAHVPKTKWDIDSLETVIKLVRGNHIEDEVAKRAALLAAQPNDPALRATGATGTTPAPTTNDPMTALSDAQRQTLARQGISTKMVEEFCAKQDPPMPVGKWFERYGKSAIGGNA